MSRTARPLHGAIVAHKDCRSACMPRMKGISVNLRQMYVFVHCVSLTLHSWRQRQTSIQEEKVQEEDAAYLELLVRDVALSIGGGHGSHEQGAAGHHSELQPGAVASLQLKGEHIVLVEGPAGHLVAVQGDSGAACIGNQQTEQ